MRRITLVFIGIAMLCAISARAQQRSQITIHAGKSGMFSGLGHNHTVVAPISSAVINTSTPAVEIVVNTKQMKVTDTEVSDSDRAKIQSTMLGPEVLDAEKYPEIRFRSSRIEQTSPQHYRVTGTLSLHGATKELALEVSNTSDHYHGTAKLNQTDFGIKPVSAGGGTVKVKDQLELDFDVFPGEFANANRR
jgi:YceI-like protein